jgi:hypothetical protein
MEALKQSCIHDRQAILSRRDAWTGAGVLVGGSILLSVLGIALNRAGFDMLGEAVKSAAFPVSVLLSMPFTFVKGQSWKAQCVLVGIPLVIIVLATFIATML